MAHIHGRFSVLEVSDDGGSTYDPIGGMTEGTFNVNSAEVETTDKDTGAFRTYIIGHVDGTLDGTCRYDPADTTGQGKLLDAVFAQTELAVKWYPEGTGTGKVVFSSDAIVTTVSESAPLDDVQGLSFTLRLSGTITKGVVP